MDRQQDESGIPTTNDALRRIQELSALVGNTPLLAIEFTFRHERRTLYAKAEHLNMTGSIKDRMALHILKQGYMTRGSQTGGCDR